MSGQQSSTIALETNADGTSTMSLTFAGTTSTMTTDTGGSLGALFDYQNDVLTPLTDTINSMASQFADAVNNRWRRATISTVTPASRCLFMTPAMPMAR